MAERNKRYFWLKLQNTYFNQLEQKKMRKQENGKDMQIIYLRMMLLSLDKGGYIYYQGVYDSIEEELAEEFSEDVSIVRETIRYLSENNMISFDEESNCFIPQVVDCTGSESYSAERVRRFREKKALQCNGDVTEGNTNVTSCNEEIEKEIELYKELEIDYQQIADMYNDTCVSFPRLTKLSDKRKKAIKARSKTYTLEDFKKAFEMAESSDFLKGKNNKNWLATFDWMIADENMAKILDGNYSNRSSQRQQNYTYNNSSNHSQSYEDSRTNNNRAVDSSEEKETVTLKPPVWKEPKYRIPLEEADINTEEGKEVIKDAYKKFLTRNYPGIPYTEKDMVNWWEMHQLGYEITPTGEE